MSSLLRFLTYLVALVVALGALTYGLCVAFGPSYPRIAPVRLALVPIEQIPTDSSLGSTPEGPALRIDFLSRPPLSIQGVYPILQVRFCDDKENQWWEIWSGQIYIGDKPLSETSPLPESPVTYSGYFPIVHAPKPPFPDMPPVPAVNDRAYDLRQEPRPLCIWADYGTGSFNVARTNEIKFETEQVAATLR